MTHCRQEYIPRVNRSARASRCAAIRTTISLFVLWALCAVCSVRPVAAQTRGTTDSTVNAIRVMYEKGSYLAAEVEARRYLEQQSPADSLRIAAEQYLAFALVAQGKTKTAVRHFTAILEIDSTFELDPVYTSPKILASFDEARQLKRLQRPAVPAASSQIAPRPSSGVSWRSLVFPGWEQVHQGRETHGYALIGAGAAAAGISILFEINRSNARSEYLAASTPDQAVARYDRYNRAHKAETYSVLAFAAIYLYSEIDAFINLPHSDAVAVRSDAAGLHLAIRF